MITIILEKGDYYPGETIKGNIELVPDYEIYINDIELCLQFIEEWKYMKSDQEIDNGSYQQAISYFNLGVNKFLPEGDNNLIRLDPILHLFPFEIKLPEILFPSFEYPKHDYRSYIRYSLFAKLKSPYIQISTSKLIFIFSISPKDDKQYTIEHAFNIKKWGIFGKGITKVKSLLSMKSYRFSDNIPIHIDIDNTFGKMNVTLIKFNLIRKVILKDNKNNLKEKYSCFDKVFKKIFKIEVRSGTKEEFNFAFPLSEIPYNEFSYFDNINLYNWTKRNCEFIPSVESTILFCQYIIKITLYYDGFIKKGDRPRISIPINLVHKLNEECLDFFLKQNCVTNGFEELKEEEIRKQKENDFVLINKNPCVGNSFLRSKTLNSNNTYIESIQNNNKNNISSQPKITQGNLLNNKYYKISQGKKIENFSTINENKIIENEEEAPSYFSYNEKLKENTINSENNELNNQINTQNDNKIYEKEKK